MSAAAAAVEPEAVQESPFADVEIIYATGETEFYEGPCSIWAGKGMMEREWKGLTVITAKHGDVNYRNIGDIREIRAL